MFPAVVGADLAAACRVTGAELGQRLAVRRVDLPPVPVQGRGRDDTVDGKLLKFGGQATGGHRLGLPDVTDPPHLRAGTASNDVGEGGGVAGADL